MPEPDVAVIVPAAGTGRRFGATENKVLAPLHGQAIFLHTLAAFADRDDVRQVLLVLSEHDRPIVLDRHEAALGNMKVQLVTGGPTRTQSVRNALAEVDDRCDLVAVHDAARPCIAGEWIDRVFQAARLHGAALLARPVHGTIKRVNADHRVTETLPRELFADLWEAQTPQVARRDWLIRAYQADVSATDDAALIEALGLPVVAVPGDPRNIKITTQEDLAYAAAIWPSLPTPRR